MNNTNTENKGNHGRNSNKGSIDHENLDMGKRNSSLSKLMGESSKNQDRAEILIDKNQADGLRSFKRVPNSDSISYRSFNGTYDSLPYQQEEDTFSSGSKINNSLRGMTPATLRTLENEDKHIVCLEVLRKDCYDHDSLNKNFDSQPSTETFDVETSDSEYNRSKRISKSISKEKSIGVPPQDIVINYSQNNSRKRKGDELESVPETKIAQLSEDNKNIKENDNPLAVSGFGANTSKDHFTGHKKPKKEHGKGILKIDVAESTGNQMYQHNHIKGMVDQEALFYNLDDIPPTLFASLDNINEYLFFYKKIKSINLKSILPPINLKVLKEIELKENLKNVQLRHDIVFDPYLQFKPNVDGERGLQKRKLEHKYWNYLLVELVLLFKSPETFDPQASLLHTMFTTLRDIMASLLKESELSTGNSKAVNDEILNLYENISPDKIVTDLHTQKNFDITNFADYLKMFLQRLCAPMRDPLIDTLHNNFIESATILKNKGDADDIKMFTGILNQFQFTFKILELMKLDVANHQIRLIRPALISNCVNFEKQFFLQVIFADPIFDARSLAGWLYFPLDKDFQLDLSLLEKQSPIHWTNIFKADFKPENKLKMNIKFFYNNIYVYNVLRLLSCCMLTKNMPALLRFDVSRLCLLRSDLRECICLLIIKFLYKQLIFDDKTIVKEEDKLKLLKMYDTGMLKSEILGIITDNKGAYRWTKNVTDLALYLLNKIITFKAVLHINSEYEGISQEKISFTQNWLQKQIQPYSNVYQLLEHKVIKSIAQYVQEKSQIDIRGSVDTSFFESLKSPQNISPNTTSASYSTSVTTINAQDSLFQLPEIDTLKNNLYQLICLNWSVVGEKYPELLFDKVSISYDTDGDISQ